MRHRIATAGLLIAVAPSCTGNDWRFDARVERVTDDEICLALVGEGPGYLDGNCVPAGEVVGLPPDVVSGACLSLNQHLHGDLVFEGRTAC